MIAVSLNVCGGIRLIKRRNCICAHKNRHMAPGVHGHGFLLLSHSGKIVIGRLRKSGEQKIDIISLLLNKFS